MTEQIVIHVFVAGMTPSASRALKNIYAICKEYHGERVYDIHVVDILKDPEAAERHKIIATPTIIKSSPPPLSKLIGDADDREQTLTSLNLHPQFF